MEKIVPTGNQPQVQDFSLLDKTLRSHLHSLWDCPSDFPVCDRFFPKLLSWGLNYTRGLNLGSQQPLSSLNLPPSHMLFLPFHHWFIPNFCGWNPCLSGWIFLHVTTPVIGPWCWTWNDAGLICKLFGEKKHAHRPPALQFFGSWNVRSFPQIEELSTTLLDTNLIGSAGVDFIEDLLQGRDLPKTSQASCCNLGIPCRKTLIFTCVYHQYPSGMTIPHAKTLRLWTKVRRYLGYKDIPTQLINTFTRGVLVLKPPPQKRTG